MDVKFILAISVLLQFTAAFLALRLIRITGKRIAWILIATGISFMAMRRSITLSHLLSGDVTHPPDQIAELVALATSIFMVAGAASIAPIFLSIKRSGEALRESEERYRKLVETMNEGLGVQDENGMVTYVNDRFFEMLGYSRDEIVGHHVFDFLDEANRSILKDQMARRKKGEKGSYEIVWTRKNGQKIYTIVSPQPIFDANGQFRGGFAVVTDITGRKQAEEALRNNEEELKKRVEELEKFYDMAVGRELRMIELKEEIESLKEELKNIKSHGIQT